MGDTPKGLLKKSLWNPQNFYMPDEFSSGKSNCQSCIIQNHLIDTRRVFVALFKKFFGVLGDFFQKVP